MGNPIFDAMNGGGNVQLPGIFNSMPMPPAMRGAFSQFINTFQGDPRQQVEQLLQSGRMSQQQFNQFASMANQFLPRK